MHLLRRKAWSGPAEEKRVRSVVGREAKGVRLREVWQRAAPRSSGGDAPGGRPHLIPRTSPPGWQVRQNDVMRRLAVISENGVPQRGQG